MSEKIRTFIAISLPESVLQAMLNAQETLKGSGLKIRWVRKEGIHLTIKFLGDIDRGDVERIHGAMKQATKAFSPLVLQGEGVGVFPDLKRPRVVWVGLSGDMKALRVLQGELEAQLAGLGFPKEKRSFKGHLTLGRIKGRMDGVKLGEVLRALGDFRTTPFTVQSVVLFQSDLRPDGAVYSRLAEARLESA
ncbi:MAG: RNA 2',3'-cyclic phosphodiesterase [Deltaproteobacteria bacterium]|nr:RNA 2',3'-cyclic phosphodiesterase [Deltaproteobacteria bacterium]